MWNICLNTPKLLVTSQIDDPAEAPSASFMLIAPIVDPDDDITQPYIVVNERTDSWFR